jgi:sporulation protein YabP
MAQHSLYLSDCKIMELTGVSSVNTFNEEQIILETGVGFLAIVGTNLHITNLNLEEGKVAIQGDVVNIEYKPQGASFKARGKSVISRLLK